MRGAVAAPGLGYLDAKATEAGLSLGYLIIVPQVLFTGIFITIDSWARAYRERTLLNVGSAAYNTYAQIHNTYHAIEGMGDAFASVLEFFSSSSKKSSSDDDDDNGGAAIILVIILVVVAIFGGILTTNAIINYTAGRREI